MTKRKCSRKFELLGIGTYEIDTLDGHVIVEEVSSEMEEVIDGKANIHISLEFLLGFFLLKIKGKIIDKKIRLR